MEERILVISIDRDADIAVKIGLDGPIIGREENLNAAVSLGLADPTETDTNTIFEAIRLYDNYKALRKNVEVVTVVGDEIVGVISDEKIAKQLDSIIEKFKPTGVIIVTDGAEDEYILPIIQSRVPVISLSRVIMKQSENLESTYYLILDFMREIVSDTKLSRLVLGIPGLALILYMLLGPHSWRVIFGIAGFFLLIKGFQLESYFEKGYEEFKTSFIAGKISFFTYAVAMILTALGLIMGRAEALNQGTMSNIDYLPYFLTGSIDFFMFAAIVAIIGKSIDALVEGLPLYKYGVLIIFVIALRLIFSSVALFLEDKLAKDIFALTITVGLVLTIVAFIGIKGTGKKAEIT
ncbi:MAG TPA: DUF373 family protein [Euryarchaeota archaeon]|nr:hypothetical protein BMS3Bbin15_01824 [archaeon BMS3Bbin15]HDL16117.1 DUF373 family protein [Euryarchaeota archaeon]